MMSFSIRGVLVGLLAIVLFSSFLMINTAPTLPKQNSTQVQAQVSKKEVKKTLKQKKTTAKGGKNQLLAGILCFFVGILGIHRMYLGYIGIGILQLLTLGGCGIWTLIDFIRICIGDLKPAEGEYENGKL